MRATQMLVVAITLLAACSRQPDSTAPVRAEPAVVIAQAAAPATGVAVLSFDGYGPVKFGAKLSDAEQQVGEHSGVTDPACSMVRFKALPGARFMVEQGVITRADADPGSANSLGLKVGDTLAQATARHPGLSSGPHKYLPNGHYLTMHSPNRRAAIVIEEDGTGIIKIRAGLQPAVGYVESCL
jgi:hypothetical protein